MATNIRIHHVVEPGRTAEYDRIARVSPIVVLVGGILMACVFAVASIVSNLGDNGMTFMLLLAALVALGGIVIAFRLADDGARRREAISRPLEPLRAVIVFDEESVSDEALWDAAGIALQCEELEDATDDIASARYRTVAQDEVYISRESQLHEMGQRILALVA